MHAQPAEGVHQLLAARASMITPTGMYAVQKREKNMSRHLSMSVGALDRERRCRRSSLEPALAGTSSEPVSIK